MSKKRRPTLLPFDAAEFLNTPEACRSFLEEAFSSDDSAIITHAIGVLARAQGMTRIAKDAGLGRESLYKSLTADGHPSFETIHAVVKALGFRLTISKLQ